jgi:hypothetical protein
MRQSGTANSSLTLTATGLGRMNLRWSASQGCRPAHPDGDPDFHLLTGKFTDVVGVQSRHCKIKNFFNLCDQIITTTFAVVENS